MRFLRWIFYGLTVLALLLVAGLAAVYYLNPFAPAVVVSDPGPGGVRITQSGLIANYFQAEGEGRRPGILMLGGSEGGIGGGMQRLAVKLRDAGYNVLIVSYYRAPGQSDVLELIPLEQFDRAIAWLGSRPEVDPARLAILGGSKGAEAALIVATRHPELKAVVAGMPSSVAWQGIDWNFVKMMLDPPDGSWSLEGKPIPFLPFGQPREYSGDLIAFYQEGLKNLGRHPAAIIPVEKISGHVLLICGRKDTLWPACDMASQIEARARANGGPQVTILAYDDAGHGVLGLPVEPDNPNFQRLGSLGGSPEANNAARKDGLEKILKHLETALAPPPPVTPAAAP